jgi:SulP family sulfate permease
MLEKVIELFASIARNFHGYSIAAIKTSEGSLSRLCAAVSAEFTRLAQFSVNYRIILLATFALTVIFDLSRAVEIGLVLASLFFIYRVSELTRLEPIDLASLGSDLPPEPGRPAHEHVAAYRLFGSLFFGAVGKVEALLDHSRENIKVVILEMHQVISIDTTGLDAIETLHRVLREEQRFLVLAALNPQPLSLLRRSGFMTTIGAENVVPSLFTAVERARTVDYREKPR